MDSVFCLAIVAFQLQLVQFFREKFLELFAQHDKVPFLILVWERSFFYLQSSNSFWLEKKKKCYRVIRCKSFYRTLQIALITITLSCTEFSTSSRWINFSSLDFTSTFYWNFSSSFLFANNRTWAYELFGLSRLNHGRVTQIFPFVRSNTSTTLWHSLSCSSKSLESVGISIGDKFSSIAWFSAAMTNWFLNCKNWLKSVSPAVRFCTSRNSLLSSFLKILSSTSK